MSLRLTRYAFLGLLGLLSVAACTRPRTQIMVRLGTDMTQGAGNELPAIRVQVTGEEAGAVHYDQTLQLGTGGVTLPQELGLVPARRKSALVTVQVDALDGGGGVIFTKRVSTHYVPDKTLLLDIFLASRCLDSAARVCPSDQSCGGAGCESDTRTNLPEYDGPPSSSDGGNTRDFAVAMDLAGADLTAGEPDLNVVPEPDLLGADLVGADFTVVVPDMAAAPDLIVPDLKVLPDFSGVDLSAAPVITNLAPANVVLGIDGLTITGMRLVNGTTSVTINGVAQTITTSSATEIVIAQVNTATPPGNGVDVVVLTDAGPGMAPVNILPRLAMTKAESKSATEVEVTFNRALNASTVQSDRFTAAGLTINNATAVGAVVTLTTTAQVQGGAYALHVTSQVLDTFGTAAIDHLVPFGGPLPTEFVVVVVGNGMIAAPNTAPVTLERRSIATPSTLVTSLAMPSTNAASDMGAPEDVQFTLMYGNSAEGSLSRSPDGTKLAMMGYGVAYNTAGAGTDPPASPRLAALISSDDFATPAGIELIVTGQFPAAQVRTAVVDGNNLWVGGGNTGIWYRTVSSSGSFTNVTTGPAASRVLAIHGGQLFVTASEIGSSPYTRGLYPIGTGTPVTSVGPTTIIDADTNLTPPLQPYSYALFDVGDEPGLDLLYLFEESSSLRRYEKEGGDWKLKATFTGAIRQGTCWLDGADAVCLGTTSLGVYMFRDAGRSSLSGSLGTAKLTQATGFQFRGLALAPSP